MPLLVGYILEVASATLNSHANTYIHIFSAIDGDNISIGGLINRTSTRQHHKSTKELKLNTAIYLLQS